MLQTRTQSQSLRLGLQTTELAHERSHLSDGTRHGSVPTLVVRIDAPRYPIEDRSNDGKVLVSQIGKERVVGGLKVDLLFLGWRGNVG
jgi:hypothetical protein